MLYLYYRFLAIAVNSPGSFSSSPRKVLIKAFKSKSGADDSIDDLAYRILSVFVLWYALEFFIDNYDKYKEVILEAVYDYYDYRKSAWGGDDPDDPKYPVVKNAEEVYEMMTLSSIIIGYNYNPGKHDIHFIYDCTFEEEGVGICMTDLNVDKIGIQGIAV